MKRKPIRRTPSERKTFPEDYEEREARLRTKEKKRVVGKYKPSRHSK